MLSTHYESVLDIKAEKIDDVDGNELTLREIIAEDAKVLLFVNIASKWGLTEKNYEQLVQID